MRVIPPIPMTDARVISSTAPESAPAAYAGGTTYAINATVSTGTVGGVISVWQSLQAGNVGHTPASSPTWWQLIGTTYSDYSAGTTYALGDRVIVVGSDSHHAYESLQAGNVGHTPASSPTYWADLGPTNRWAMFDLLRNTQTDVPSPLTVVISPGQRINSIGLVGLQATSATLTVTSVTGGGTVYTATQNLNLRETLGWYDYFFLPFDYQESMVLWDLPAYSDAQIALTLTNTRGNVKCGGVVLGTFEYLGEAQYGADADTLNFSSVTRDDYGNSQLVPRRNVPKTAQTLLVEKSRVNRLRKIRDELNAAPALWSGLDDDTDGYFEALFILGYYRRFSISAQHPTHAIVTLELEEI